MLEAASDKLAVDNNITKTHRMSSVWVRYQVEWVATERWHSGTTAEPR